MKKMILFFAAIAIAGSAVAAPVKPAVKPVRRQALPAVEAPTIPSLPKDTAESADSKFIIQVWGGYSLNANTDLVKAVDKYGDATATPGNNFNGKSTDAKTQGIAAGMDFWYGDKFQFGLGAYYLQGFKSIKTLNYGTGSVMKNITQMNYIPILLQVRYFLFEGIYLGAGAGMAMMSGSKTDTTVDFIGLPGTPYSDNYTGTAIWAEGRLGYRLALGEMLGLDVFSIFSYQLSTVTFKDANTASTLSSFDVKNNGMNITPGLAFSLRF